MPRILRSGLAVVALLLSFLVMPALAGAANTNPNGAQVVNINNLCQPFPGGVQTCVTVRSEINAVTTPAGNQVFVANGRVCLSFIGPTGQVFGQNCQDFHNQALTQDGTAQEGHLSFRVTFSDGGCSIVRYHYANGQIQFQDFSPTC